MVTDDPTGKGSSSGVADGPDVAVTAPTVGATFSTLTVVELLLEVAPSLTVAWIVYAVLEPDGSSRYLWVTENELTPGSKESVLSGEPSPQLTVTVCGSSESGSMKEPRSRTDSFSLIVFGLTLSAPVPLAVIC